MQIGERQTVQHAKHPTLGEGRLVYDNGPCFFLADTGEVERYQSVRSGGCGSEKCSRGRFRESIGRLASGADVTLDTLDRQSGPRHIRVVRVPENQPGWLSMWLDDFRTWCHVFEPDGGKPIKFAVAQAWIGGPQDDGGNTPKKRDHLWTRKGRDIVFTYYDEEDRAIAEAAGNDPDAPRRDKTTAPRGPMPGPGASRAEIDAYLKGST